MLTRTSGRVRHIRPLPSDSTTTSVPVSATAKLAPETAIRAPRNFSRRCRRLASARAAGSSVRSSGAGRPTRPISRRKISRISARLRWIAGTRMWLGRSFPSWTMSSAKSVSQAAMPWSARDSLRPISWVAIDLTLTTSSTSCDRAMSATIAQASSSVRAQWTVTPRSVRRCSRSSRWSPRSRRVRSLMSAARVRSPSQSSSSPMTEPRLSRIVCVAWWRLARSCSSASAACAASGKGGIPRKVGWSSVVVMRPPPRQRAPRRDAWCARDPLCGRGSRRSA